MSQSQVPKLVQSYFAAHVWGGWEAVDRDRHPLIAQVFTPSTGWRRYSGTKRVSVSWLRKLRAEGVTHVALASPVSPNRIADFSIMEICRGESKSYPCGICT